MELEKILTRETLASPHRSYASSVDRDESYGKTLAEALKQAVRKDLSAY